MKLPSSPLHSSATKGFSLLELLFTISVIGIIGALALTSMGSVNSASVEACARRNAQSLASITAAAQAAGYEFSFESANKPETAIYSALSSGVAPTSGIFKGRRFVVPALPPLGHESEVPAEVSRILKYVSWDSTTQTLNYSDSVASL